KFNSRRNLISYFVKRQPKMSMDIELFMPKGMDAGVTIASGKIVVRDLNSQVEVNSASGMIEIRDIEGKVTAVVASGRLDVADIKGDVELQVVSGALNATDVSGDAVVGVNSGTIELAHLGGDLDCSIEYGTVVVDGVGGLKFEGISAHASFTGVRGAINASTASGKASFRVKPGSDVNYSIIASSGDITVRFLEKMAGGYILKAGTTSGEISVTLPIDVKNVGRNNITGVVREGKARIFLETASGDIIIEEPEE
ncbi:MAG TPA: DUF4097 family beta strand repeat-containing protein, partial [Candidatus Krumholzibacterium sp.]|nr:DUF4097 family beta strand repeat-containing protein [Candidatus Krumholzibacterium sp.]